MMGDDASKLPNKLYYRIGEVASLVGVEPHVLRYWEREFRTIRPRKSARGQRVYSRRDVETLMRVRELLYSEGFTIAGARRRLQQERSNGSSSVEPAPDIVDDEVSAQDDEDDDPPPREIPRARRSSPSVERNLPLFDPRALSSAAHESSAAAAAAAAAPMPTPARKAAAPLGAPAMGAEVRSMLRELRGEIETFLDDLG